MRVKVLFFGMLKDIVGRVEEQVELDPGARLATVFDHYAGQFPRLRDMAGSIVIARNQEFSPLSTAVVEGDEVAFLPPVSGGADRYTHQITDPQGNFFALTRLRCPSLINIASSRKRTCTSRNAPRFAGTLSAKCLRCSHAHLSLSCPATRRHLPASHDPIEVVRPEWSHDREGTWTMQQIVG
jgi:molybdopterin synthase catalytic subunit